MDYKNLSLRQMLQQVEDRAAAEKAALMDNFFRGRYDRKRSIFAPYFSVDEQPSKYWAYYHGWREEDRLISDMEALLNNV